VVAKREARIVRFDAANLSEMLGKNSPGPKDAGIQPLERGLGNWNYLKYETEGFRHGLARISK
jgi:hypothetical protein